MPLTLIVGTAIAAESSGDNARFAQASSWAISKVTPKGSPAYCTMAARYENNAVFTIARNARAETTLAFDFQRPVFLKDQSYFLSVKIGNLLKTFNANPASSSAMVLRTGSDEGIDSAIAESGFVELSVNGGHYRFDVDGYADAQKQMALCLGADDGASSKTSGGRAPKALQTKQIAEVKAVPPEAVDGVPAQPSQVKISANADASELEAQLRAAIAERDAYHDLLEETKKKKVDEARASRPQDQVELGEALKQLDAMQAERADLIRQLERAKSDAEIADAQASAEPSQELQKANKTLSLMQAENESLRKQVEQTQKDILAIRQQAQQSAPAPDTAALDKLRGQIADLEQQNDSLRSQAEAAQNKSKAVAMLKAADAENKRLAAQLADAKEKANTSGGQKPVAKAQPDPRYAAAEAENQRLAKALHDARAELMRASTEAAQTRDQKLASEVQKMRLEGSDLSEVNRLQSRFEMAERENKRLAMELDRMRQSHTIQQQAAMPKSPTEDLFNTLAKQPPVLNGNAAKSDGADTKVAALDTSSVAMTAPASVSGNDSAMIQGLLKKAGINTVQAIEKVKSASSASMAAYRWDTGKTYGNAEVRAMGGGFDDAMRTYLRKTRSRCTGTYDESVTAPEQVDGGSMATADVACAMKDNKGSGASIVFFAKDGQFNVIAHESDLNTLDTAMDSRDKVAKAVKDSL